jgi:hypothetical protein
MRGLAAGLASIDGDGAAARHHVEVALESQRGRVCAGLRIDLAYDSAIAFGRLSDHATLDLVWAELDPHLAPLGVVGGVAARRGLAGARHAAHGDHAAAVADLLEARRLHQQRGAVVPAAITGLALAAALDGMGDATAADQARAQSDALLGPLGVVYPI